MKRLLSGLTVMAVAACSDSTTLVSGHLADALSSGHVQVDLNEEDDLRLVGLPHGFVADGGRVLSLSYNTAHGCLHLGSTTATVNGVALTAVSLGQVVSTRINQEGPECDPPQWLVPDELTRDAVSSFLLSDTGSEMRVDYQNVGAQRSGTVLSPASGARPGETVVVTWDPPTDSPFVDVVYRGSNGSEFVSPTSASSPTGRSLIEVGRVTFQVPASALPGNGTLMMRGNYTYGVSACAPSGLRCQGSVTLGTLAEFVDGGVFAVLP